MGKGSVGPDYAGDWAIVQSEHNTLTLQQNHLIIHATVAGKDLVTRLLEWYISAPVQTVKTLQSS